MINGMNIFYSSGGVQPHFCPWKNVCFPIFSHGEKWGKKYMEREGNEYFSLSFHILFSHFSPWEKMGKHTFFHGQKWGKKYMEREGNEYFSLSFHILFFPFFPMGKNGKTHIFPWAKMGLDPPLYLLRLGARARVRLTICYKIYMGLPY